MKMLKEFGFIALFILVVVVIIGILFFEFIPTQVIEEPAKYEQAEATAKLLSQIQEEQQPDTQGDKKEEVLQSYEVTKNQLYNSEQAADYISGKAHPFYNYNAKTENGVPGEGTALDGENANTLTPSENANTQSGNKTNTNKVDTDNLVDKTNTVTTK